MTDLSLQEAARLYDLSVRTLGQRIRNGEIEAYKSEGDNRGEWRVSTRTLEASGYRLRAATPAPRVEANDARTVKKLERELAAARRAAALEHRRAEQADRRLGKAFMEIGRLRAALAAETSRRVHAELAAEARPER